jgi:ferric-dicitrate binding protein FerR (iron transport regulator)
MRCLLAAFCLTASLGAAEAALAMDTQNHSYTPGERILAGTAGKTLSLAGFVRSEVLLAPRTTVHLSKSDGELTIDLDAGSIQVDVEGLGPWKRLIVRGAAVEVSVHGTLFVVARDRRRVDTVSLVRGQVQLRLRKEIIAALGQDPTIDLIDHQQVTGDANGFGTVSSFSGPIFLVASASSEDGGVGEEIMDGMMEEAAEGAGEIGDEITDALGGGFGPPPGPP